MLIAADNITASRPRVRKALEARDQDWLGDHIRDLARAGAGMIDLNPGFVSPKEREEVWRFLVETAEAATDLPLILDAPNAETLALALRFCARKPVLNMATAEPDRLAAMLDLARAHETRLIAACMIQGAPLDAAGRLELAAYIAAQAAGYGITGERLILDPMVMPLALPDGERHANAVLETLRSLSQVIDPAPASLIALSNLTTRTAGRDAGSAAGPFLAAAFGAGLGICMLDVLNRELTKTAALLQVFSGGRLFAPAEFEQP